MLSKKPWPNAIAFTNYIKFALLDGYLLLMMTIKKQIPNTITLLNLFCGCIAMVFASKADFEMAFYFVSLGIFLDFFDFVDFALLDVPVFLLFTVVFFATFFSAINIENLGMGWLLRFMSHLMGYYSTFNLILYP